MTSKSPQCNYVPMFHPATDHPVLFIDANATLSDLHACVSERLSAVLKYLDLMACIRLPDHAEQDINTVTTIARIIVQDVSDLFRVIEKRKFDVP
ncbi:fructose-bisphosphate aldolase [Pseudomonas sp. NMS19W]|uniref:fructose-bisphosphate aldolase n=1 Tax=Pseudomonas sp. NMS19W TaxID=3079768 RepID=UPI003F659544